MPPEIIIHSFGEAAQWEYIANSVPDGFPDGSKLWFAEVKYRGTKYTLYFDVSPEEAEDEEKIKQWIVNEWDWSK